MIGVDDIAGTATEFEGHLLEVRSRRGFEEGSADGSGTGEGEHVDAEVLAHGGADSRTGAREYVEDAVGHPCLGGESGEVKGAERRVLGGFDNHGIAGGQGRGDLPAEHGDGIVPRQDRSDDSAGHFRHPAPPVGALQIASVIAGDEVGAQSEVRGDVGNVFLDAAEGDLSGFDAVEIGDLFGVGFDEVGEATQHAGSQLRIVDPVGFVEGGACCGDRLIELLLARRGEAADDRALAR